MNLERYAKRAGQNIDDDTLRVRLTAQRSLETFIGDKDEPDVDDVEEWIDYLIDRHDDGEIKASTIREYFKGVKYYFQVVLREDTEEFDRISGWLPENDSDAGDYLTEEEWDMMKRQVQGYRDSAIIEVMYYYARRPTEVILLNEEDIGTDTITEEVDGEEVEKEVDTITFNILKKKDKNLPILKVGKGDDGEWDDEYRVLRATFTLQDEPKEKIERWMSYNKNITQVIELDGEEMEVTPLFTTNHGRISYNSVYKMIKGAAEDAGIEKNVTPKAMGRHSRATHLDWSGKAPGNIARDLLVHDPETKVIGKYVHDRGEDDVRDVMTLDTE
jgi:site-specific recombinase XerD